MYIPVVLSRDFATRFDVLGSTPSTHDSITGSSTILARRVNTLRGRAGYAVGSGIAIAFISVFLLGVLARCIVRERRARQQARAHVQALAVQDNEFWGVGANSGRRIRRREEEEEEEVEQEETEAERRIRRRQERREREHGRFDSILERMERRVLEEEDLKESKKTSDGGATGQISEKELRLSDGSRASGSGSESDSSGVEKVTIPEPVYKGTGTRLSCGGRISLSNLRSSIS